MLNKFLIALGVPLVLIGMPFLLLDSVKSVLDSYIYYPKTIMLTSAFAIAPFLLWFWLLSCIGFICICFKVRPKLSGNLNRYLGAYIPCFLFLIGVCSGTLGKELIKKHLTDNGYLLITTEELRTSFYIPYDKDIYRKIN